MKLTLKRTDYTLESTIGELSIDGVFFCYTLEDVVRPKDAAKVWGKTAVPGGSYPVTLYFSPKFGCVMPHFDSVPGYAGCLLHVGNSSVDTDGCVLVGKSKSKDFIADSRVTYNKLFAKLHDAHERGEKMVLTIIDTQPSPLAAKAQVPAAKKAK